MSHFCAVINATPENRGFFSFGKSTGTNAHIFDLVKLGVAMKDYGGVADVLIAEKHGWDEFDPEGLAKLTRWLQAGNPEDYQCHCDADDTEPWYRDSVPTWYPAKGSIFRSDELDMWEHCGYLAGTPLASHKELGIHNWSGAVSPKGLEEMQKFLRTHPLVKVVGLP